jgi:hypothetical protein
MVRQLSRVGLSLLTLVGALAVLGVSPEAAHASGFGNCPTYPPAAGEHIGYQYPLAGAGDVQEIKGVVVLRRNGYTCGYNAQWVDSISSWMSFESVDGSGQITQAGYQGTRWNSTGTMQWCRFWAIGTGTSHAYNCSDGTGTATEYEIVNDYGSDQIYDCGNSNWSSCTLLGAQPHKTSVAGVYGESHYPCADQLMGISSSTAQIGKASEAVQVSLGSGLANVPWTATQDGPVCSSYGQLDYHNIYLGTYDTRN